MPSTSLTPTQTLPVSTNLYNKSTIIGAVIGSSIGGFSFAVICFLLYKWNKNKQKQKNAVPTPGSEEGNRYNHENLTISKNVYNPGQQEKILSNLSPINKQPENENRSNHEPIDNNFYNHGQEITQSNLLPINMQSNHEPIDDNVYYNHGQEIISTSNNGKSSLQNIDDDILQQLKNEMLQTLRQEIMQNLEQQNNGQASSFRNN